MSGDWSLREFLGTPGAEEIGRAAVKSGSGYCLIVKAEGELVTVGLLCPKGRVTCDLCQFDQEWIEVAHAILAWAMRRDIGEDDA